MRWLRFGFFSPCDALLLGVLVAAEGFGVGVAGAVSSGPNSAVKMRLNRLGFFTASAFGVTTSVSLGAGAGEAGAILVTAA